MAFKDARSISDTLPDTAEACNELAKLATIGFTTS